MKKTAILIHGIHTKDEGEKTVNTLKPYFEEKGFNVIEFDYDWVSVLRVRLCNKNLARALASITKNAEGKVVAVGHSNGCAIIHEAGCLGAKFNEVVYINPALNKDTKLPLQINRAHVWHSPSDKIVKLSKWLINHSWGEMGSTGYVGKSERYLNYDKENDWQACSSNTHSDVFHPGKIEFFGPKIVKNVFL